MYLIGTHLIVLVSYSLAISAQRKLPLVANAIL